MKGRDFFILLLFLLAILALATSAGYWADTATMPY
jgi:hypothetical protein